MLELSLLILCLVEERKEVIYVLKEVMDGSSKVIGDTLKVWDMPCHFASVISEAEIRESLARIGNKRKRREICGSAVIGQGMEA